MAEHTEGRLELCGANGRDAEGGYVFFCGMSTTNPQYYEPGQEADARRLVACWNAFVGWPTEAIEAMRTTPPKTEPAK